jgi:hypothetical protein
MILCIYIFIVMSGHMSIYVYTVFSIKKITIVVVTQLTWAGRVAGGVGPHAARACCTVL